MVRRATKMKRRPANQLNDQASGPLGRVCQPHPDKGTVKRYENDKIGNTNGKLGLGHARSKYDKDDIIDRGA